MSKSKPKLHPRTEHLLNRYLDSPVGNILVFGSDNTLDISKDIASSISSGPGTSIISPSDSGYISIEDIRQLIRDTRVRLSGIRCIILDQAEKLTEEAQNALLKVLEDTPDNYRLILSASQLEGLLPTIQSRLVKIEVLPDRKRSNYELAEQILEADMDTRLDLAQSMYSRVDSLNLCTQLLRLLGDKLSQTQDSHLAKKYIADIKLTDRTIVRLEKGNVKLNINFLLVNL